MQHNADRDCDNSITSTGKNPNHILDHYRNFNHSTPNEAPK